MEQRAFQDQFAEVGFEHCWGCGSHNEHGLHIKSYWEGDEGVCDWQAQPYHQAWPGIVNGGILATIIDCHCASTATAAAYRAEQRALTTLPIIPYVTASLSIAYLRPTPITAPLHLRASVKEQSGRKMTLACALSANGDICVHAEVVMVRLPAPADAGS